VESKTSGLTAGAGRRTTWRSVLFKQVLNPAAIALVCGRSICCRDIPLVPRTGVGKVQRENFSPDRPSCPAALSAWSSYTASRFTRYNRPSRLALSSKPGSGTTARQLSNATIYPPGQGVLGSTEKEFFLACHAGWIANSFRYPTETAPDSVETVMLRATDFYSCFLQRLLRNRVDCFGEATENAFASTYHRHRFSLCASGNRSRPLLRF